MTQGQAVVKYLDLQRQELLPTKTLQGEVGTVIEYEIPQIEGYLYFSKLELDVEADQQPVFIADQVQEIELRYQTVEQFQEMVHVSKLRTRKMSNKLEVLGELGDSVPVVDENNHPLLGTTAWSKMYLNYLRQKQVGDTTLYNIGSDQWLRAGDVKLRPEIEEDYGPSEQQISATATVNIPDNMQVTLWQIDENQLVANHLPEQLLDNGTELQIDRQIQVGQDLFYHIVDSAWIKANRVVLK